MQKTITVCGVDFDVEYSATKYYPATYWEPAEGGEVEIEEICIDGQEVSEVLSQKVLDMIYENISSNLDQDAAEARAQAAEDRAEARHEEMMERRAA